MHCVRTVSRLHISLSPLRLPFTWNQTIGFQQEIKPNFFYNTYICVNVVH